MAKCVQCGRQLPPFTFRKICQWCVQHEAAQRGEDTDDRQPVIRQPWVRHGESSITLTRVIFGVNIAVFLAMMFATGNPMAFLNPEQGFPGQVLVPYGANFGPYTLSGEWWRLVTYMFLHGGIVHIAINMWCLWSLGGLSEDLYGRWTYGAIYLITGVAGGLTSAAWNPRVLSVGASGALFGLSGALMASIYLGEFSLSGISIRGTLISLLFFTGFSLYFGFVDPLIDNGCHIGGLVSGLILGALIAKIAPSSDRPMARVGVLVFVLLIVTGAGLGVARWRGPGMRFGRAIANAQRSADRMIGELQKQIQKNPQDASAHYALANQYFLTGQDSQGVMELKRVLELDPANVKARAELGSVYLDQGKPKEAQEEFAKLVAQDPNNVDGHAGLAVALVDGQNYAQAINEYKTLLRLEPDARGLYYRMGLSQAQLKQYDDAISSYTKERERGDDAVLESALAEAYEAKGMTKEAEGARNRAQQLRGGAQ